MEQLTRKQCYDYIKGNQYLRDLIKQRMHKNYTICNTECLRYYVNYDKEEASSKAKLSFWQRLASKFR